MQAERRHRTRLMIGVGLIVLIASPLAAQTLLGQPGQTPPQPFTLPPSVTGIPAAPAPAPAQSPASPARPNPTPAASQDPNQPGLTGPAPPATWQPRQVAELVALDKVSAGSKPIQLRVGQTATFNSLSITLKSCVARPPDQAPDSAGFLDIKDAHPGANGFAGWMIASSPALNSFQHPVYDVILKSCHN